MFDGLIYEINTRFHMLNVTVVDDCDLVRNLRIIDKDGKIHVLCTADNEDV